MKNTRLCALVALFALVLASACSSPSGPTPIDKPGDPNPMVSYTVGTERVDRDPTVGRNRVGSQSLNIHPAQPLAAGKITVQGLSLTGDVDLYIYPTSGDLSQVGVESFTRFQCLTGAQKDGCPIPIAGPVRAVNGQNVEVGTVSGVTPLPAHHLVVFYLHGDAYVSGSLVTTITGPKP